MREPLAGGGSALLAKRVPLSLELAIDLVLCGLVLAAFSIVAQKSHPAFSCLAFFTGLVGGGLCVLCGPLGRRVAWCRSGAMVTLAAVAVVAGYQMARSWLGSVEAESSGRMVVTMMALWIVFCLGTMVNLFQEGKSDRA